MVQVDTTTNAGQLLAAASGGRRRRGDRIFSNTATVAAVTILAPAGRGRDLPDRQGRAGADRRASELPGGKTFIDYVAPLAFGTVLAAGFATVVAVPLAVAVALFITHIAPPRLALTLGYLVDLLAAIPSIIYGLWGIFVLGPAAVPVMKWLEEKLGFIPILRRVPPRPPGARCSSPGLVLAVMILPIVSAVAREVFSQTPRKLQEGAQALGATRWEMIRMTVLPFGRSSVISGAMLGLGRALGETMAVTIILSVSGGVTFNLISQANPSTIAANIALNFPESSGLAINAADRDRARPLRDHPRHQPRSAGDHRPPGRSVDGRRRRQHAARARRRDCRPAARRRHGRRHSARAGRPTASSPAPSPSALWSRRRSANFTIALTLAFSVFVATVGIYAWSRAVEGPRRAVDRAVTMAIVAAFGLAMAPLISLLYEVVKRGVPGLSCRILHRGRARQDRRRRRRARDRRHPDHHRRRRRDLGPDRADGGDLHERVRDRQAAPGADLLRRRDDRHPLDRRRPLRLRAVRDLPRPRHPPRGDGLGRALGADDPDRDPLRRGDPEDRPRPPARSLLRARHPEVEDDHQGRPADRLRRSRHRRDARDRADHRRDGAAAGHDRRRRLAQHQPLPRPHVRTSRSTPTTSTDRPA